MKIKKAVQMLAVVFLLAATSMLGGCGGEGETAGAPASVPVPSLAELAGKYEDGSITFEKVHVSQELLDKAQRKADDATAAADPDDPFDQIEVAGAGCDIEMLNTLLSYEGTTQPGPFTITAAGETEGTLQFESADEEEGEDDTEAISFLYNPDNGALTFAELEDGVRLADSLYASYLEAGKVGISGTLRLTVSDAGESDFYIDLAISGTKPAGGQ